ncbi:hypothetical protein Tco_0602069 [Tanacetum coccineum]
MTGTKFDIEKFDGTNDFTLWQVRMKALPKQQGLVAALEELPAATIPAYNNVIQKKAFSALILCLGDWVLREITKETTAAGIWKKLETSYMTKSLANRLYLEKKLYTFNMHSGKSQSEHIDEFHKLDTLKLEDVLATLNSRELQKMTKAKGDGGEGLYVRGRSVQIDIVHGIGPARRRRQPQVRQTSVESSNLEKPDNPPIVTMADNRTMAQLLEDTTEVTRNAIVIPEITANNFEIKHVFLILSKQAIFWPMIKKTTCSNPFISTRYFYDEDSEVPNSSVKLMLFSFSLDRGSPDLAGKRTPSDD